MFVKVGEMKIYIEYERLSACITTRLGMFLFLQHMQQQFQGQAMTDIKYEHY